MTSNIQPMTPFSVELETFKALKRFNMLRLQIYDNKSDPNFYVGLYLNSMALWSGNKQLLCKVFLSSFGEITSDWFQKLPKGIIKSWKGLAEMFVARFVMNKSQPQRVDSLLALKISDGEGLKAYAKRYYEVYTRILGCNQEVAVVSFKNSQNDQCSFRKSLFKTLPKSMKETGARSMQVVSTVFRILIYKVLERIKNQPYYRLSKKIPGEFMDRSTRKHCANHNEDGHLTQRCMVLKSHLEDLVRQGHLSDLVNEVRTREEHARLPQTLAAHLHHHHHHRSKQRDLD
ncbi:uncharacterized protein LOC114298169 [Camellia sinensis]|uniref:uncharacterized protein LOC114298169 n=1 Tax=Camellia sinensis TaxID=4442 RepID=UPI001035EF0D|nr:uncharacterized protein LOC114298169 [Camellia sinensis]